jgi:hypothetical protein
MIGNKAYSIDDSFLPFLNQETFVVNQLIDLKNSNHKIVEPNVSPILYLPSTPMSRSGIESLK